MFLDTFFKAPRSLSSSDNFPHFILQTMWDTNFLKDLLPRTTSGFQWFNLATSFFFMSIAGRFLWQPQTKNQKFSILPICVLKPLLHSHKVCWSYGTQFLPPSAESPYNGGKRLNHQILARRWQGILTGTSKKMLEYMQDNVVFPPISKDRLKQLCWTFWKLRHGVETFGSCS